MFEPLASLNKFHHFLITVFFSLFFYFQLLETAIQLMSFHAERKSVLEVREIQEKEEN